MAKKSGGSEKIVLSKKKSIGGHSKSDSTNKNSANYKKKYRGQGR
jgi:hypothetical protein